jgi:hypothetical protein
MPPATSVREFDRQSDPNDVDASTCTLRVEGKGVRVEG